MRAVAFFFSLSLLAVLEIFANKSLECSKCLRCQLVDTEDKCHRRGRPEQLLSKDDCTRLCMRYNAPDRRVHGGVCRKQFCWCIHDDPKACEPEGSLQKSPISEELTPKVVCTVMEDLEEILFAEKKRQAKLLKSKTENSHLNTYYPIHSYGTIGSSKTPKNAPQPPKSKGQWFFSGR